MRNSKRIILILTVFVIGLASCSTETKEPVDYVNPYMGNISHLLVPTYPTVQLPNGMMRVYPERTDFTSDRIKGLPLIVTSHRGKSAFNLSFFQGEKESPSAVYKYHYDNEKITPYQYSVYLEEEQVEATFAPSYHSAIYKLEFFADGSPSLIFNTSKGRIRYEDGSVKGWQELANGTVVHIWAEFSDKVEADRSFDTNEGNYVVVTFGKNAKEVSVRYGISFIDEDQAESNLRAEIPDFDLSKVAAKGRSVWNDKLGKIMLGEGCENDKTVFYTSLYRTYERMICLSEGNRYFSAFDGKVHEDKTPFYTDDWVWDTYRAAHPLRVLTEPEMEVDMINSYARMSEQMTNHWMPTFPEVTGDSRRMNSNHAVAFVADAIEKGLTGFDVKSLYEYCRDGLTEKTLAPWSDVKSGPLSEFYWKHGYIPALPDGAEEIYPEVHPFEKRQPVAVTLGTAYDQWCLSILADHVGESEMAEYFRKGSLGYRTVWNSDTKFFHPKDEQGNFIMPFDYSRSGGLGARNAYDENNGWVYRWDVQHNIADLVALMGGADNFCSELDRMFDTPLGTSKFEFFAQLPDHSGIVGQFSMANEPSLHIPYLYNYGGQAWKTQKRIHTLLRSWFRNDFMGLPGDEDGGGMSAFVVFSMMGFYPVTPGLPMYNIGSPFFGEVKMDIGNGKTFTVKAVDYSPSNKYIQSAELNGEPLDRCWFTHEELMEGGCLKLLMGDRPNKEWSMNSVPPSFSNP